MEGAGTLVERYAPVLALLALGLSLGLGVWVVRLHREVQRMLRSYRSLLNDVEGRNLEQILEDHLADLQKTSLAMNELELRQGRVEAQVRRSLQQVGIVRFNPFRDTGSDQSYSLALLDGHGDGVVLSSLYGRNGVRVYAKPVQDGTSQYTLSEEEQEAIQQARQGAV